MLNFNYISRSCKQYVCNIYLISKALYNISIFKVRNNTNFVENVCNLMKILHYPNISFTMALNNKHFFYVKCKTRIEFTNILY